MKSQKVPTAYNGGFTLVEIAVVLTIVALLSAGALTIFRVQHDRERYADTRAALQNARDALVSYAMAKGALPCPAKPLEADQNAFGTEQTGCSPKRGMLPWKTLGVTGTDGWGRYLSYEVSKAFATPPVAGVVQFNLSTPGTVDVFSAAIDGKPQASSGAVAFAIWSHGPNGHFAISNTGTQIGCCDASGSTAHADEAANSPVVSGNVIAHDESVSAVSDSSFDDIVIWTSRYVFFKKVAEGGTCIPQPIASGASGGTCG